MARRQELMWLSLGPFRARVGARRRELMQHALWPLEAGVGARRRDLVEQSPWPLKARLGAWLRELMQLALWPFLALMPLARGLALLHMALVAQREMALIAVREGVWLPYWTLMLLAFLHEQRPVPP